MATVFLVGELGPNRRDLPPLLILARELERKGRHRPVFVLRDVMGATLMMGHEGYAVLQAPVWRAGRPKRDEVPLTAYGDYLGNIGFDDVDAVQAVLGQWTQLIDHMKPDLIIAHNSPGACLAAYGHVPVITIGDGYTVPPGSIEAFPELIAGHRAAFDQSVLLANVNAALATRRTPKLRSFPALFFTAGRFPCVLPDLDPYKGWRTRPAWGPLDALPKPRPLPDAPFVHVSLETEFYQADAVLTAIAAKGLPGSAVLRGMSRSFLDGLSWPGIDVATRRGEARRDGGDPRPDVAKASLVVHDGTLGLTTLCAALGRPQLIFPNTPERSVIASRAAESGAVRVAHGEPTPERIMGMLDDVMKMTPEAERWATAIAATDSGNAARAVLARCLKVLGGRGC